MKFSWMQIGMFIALESGIDQNMYFYLDFYQHAQHFQGNLKSAVRNASVQYVLWIHREVAYSFIDGLPNSERQIASLLFVDSKKSGKLLHLPGKMLQSLKSWKILRNLPIMYFASSGKWIKPNTKIFSLKIDQSLYWNIKRK